MQLTSWRSTVGAPCSIHPALCDRIAWRRQCAVLYITCTGLQLTSCSRTAASTDFTAASFCQHLQPCSLASRPGPNVKCMQTYQHRCFPLYHWPGRHSTTSAWQASSSREQSIKQRISRAGSCCTTAFPGLLYIQGVLSSRPTVMLNNAKQYSWSGNSMNTNVYTPCGCCR